MVSASWEHLCPGLCLPVHILLCVRLMGKDVFTYRSDEWFSLKLRDLRLANKNRWCLVERLNIEWSFAPFLKNAAWFG